MKMGYDVPVEEKILKDWSRELSVVRINLECVISILKQKYTILQGFLPINYCDSADEDSIIAIIDKIIPV